jgi:hypothetical protein
VPNFLGWLIGVFVGLILVLAIFIALGIALPATVGFLAAVVAAVAAVVGTLTPQAAITMAVVILGFIYVWAYAFATASVAAFLPAVALPLTTPVPVPGGVPTPLPAAPGELFARGLMIGLTATFNAAILSLIPIVGPFIAVWAFVIISLAAVILVARNRVFQGFLGWSAWLFPMSYPATLVGLLLFIANFIPAFASLGINAFRTDWTTGVIETAGGMTGITGFVGGFSLGNFTFITPGVPQGPFTASSLNSHETGHSLNTAAMSGVVLWINAIDENVPPFRRLTIAYGELTAESHTRGIGGPPRARFLVRLWG